VESILILILCLAVIGVVLWGVITYVPMPAPFKGVIIVIGAVLALIFLMRAISGGALDIPG
jgi:uncharacterized membrane protein